MNKSATWRQSWAGGVCSKIGHGYCAGDAVTAVSYRHTRGVKIKSF